MNESPELAAAKQRVRDHGLTPSVGCWEDERTAYAFSVERAGAATYGHPLFEMQIDKRPASESK